MKRYLQALRSLSVAALMASACQGAHAYLTNPGTCTTDSATIVSMEESPLDGANQVFDLSPGGRSATSCFGVITGLNDPADPSPNIGELGDGLLNGEGGLIDPLQFIQPGQLLDLDGDGNPTDPGWIFLGKVESANGQDEYVMDGYNKPLNIDDILTFSLKCTSATGDVCREGTWSLETELDIVQTVQTVLGRSSFDHLAFVLKGGNAFAIYDFDFNILLQELLAAGSGFDFETPYSFTGTWNMDDFVFPNDNGRGGLDPRAMSHVSVWVRDPLDATSIPEPGTIGLVALALVGLALAGIRRNGALVPVDRRH